MTKKSYFRVFFNCLKSVKSLVGFLFVCFFTIFHNFLWYFSGAIETTLSNDSKGAHEEGEEKGSTMFAHCISTILPRHSLLVEAKERKLS